MQLHPMHLQHNDRKVALAVLPNYLFCFLSFFSWRRARHFFGISFLFLIIFFSVPAWAHDPFDIELKVWSSQSFDDPFCSDDAIDLYFRVNRTSYITVYQINPYGGIDILYPLACHRWIPVHSGRTYRLIDLADDLDLFYDGMEGRAYIGLVATRQPIDIVPWLEAGFRDSGVAFGRPSRVVVNVDFRLVIDRVLADVRLRLGSACAPSYYVAPIYVRPRPVVYYRPPVIIYPAPPRHKSYPPKWGHGDDDYSSERDYESQPYRRSPEPPEKRPFRRRGYEAPEINRTPESPKPSEPQRSYPDKRSTQKEEELKVKNESKGSTSARRVKKPRND